MARLSISLLGPIRVTLNGKALPTFRSNKALALLTYLAVESESVHRRGTLAGLFWPDRSEQAARHNLSQTLLRLRKIIGGDEIGHPFLLTSRQTIQFNPESDHWLDADTFIRQADSVVSQANPDPNFQALHQAVDLYRGDFLEHFYLADSDLFDEWVLLKREQLRQLALTILNQLTIFYEQQANFDLTQHYARRQVEMEPYREDGHRRLMQALADSGQRSAALAQYKACRHLLAEDFGLEPSLETKQLYQQIKAGTWSAKPAPSTPESIQLPANLADINDVEQPFVARNNELTQLAQHQSAVLSGQGRVAFITGEAGSGKTAMLQAFVRQAQAQHPDLVTVIGNCHVHTGLGDPYLPFREMMNLLTGQIEIGYAANFLTGEQKRRLWMLLPVTVQALIDHGPYLVGSFISARRLRARIATIPAYTGLLAQLQELKEEAQHRRENLGQIQLFEQFAHVLQILAYDRPLLLMLEDLHWADIGSISLLSYLGQQFRSSPILIVGTYRPEEVALGRAGERHPLAKVIAEFKRQFGEIIVDLDRARDKSGRAFVDAFLDTEPNQLDETFREALYHQTEGHPLFTIELLRALQERGSLVQDSQGRWIEGSNVDWGTFPMRVEGVIEERVDRLEPSLKAMLTVAGVEGEHFTAQVIAQVLKVDEQQLVQQLGRELDRKHRLIRELEYQHTEGQPLYRYRFRHQLFQQHLYHALGQAERRNLHGQVGAVLETLYKDEVDLMAPQLAWHFAEAAQTQKALNYLLQSGEYARHLSANEEAIKHFNRGIALLQSMPNTPERAQQELAFQIPLGNAFIAGKGYAAPEVGQTYKQARELCRQLGDAPPLFPVLNGLHRFFMSQGNVQLGDELSKQLLDLAQTGSDPHLLTEAFRALGVTLWYQGKFGEAQSYFEQGIDYYSPDHHATYVQHYGEDPGVMCLSYSAWTLWLMGYPDQALKRSQKALALSRELGHYFSLGQALAIIAALHQCRQETQQTEILADEALVIGTKHNLPFLLTPSTILQGWALIKQQQAEKGLAEIGQALLVWQASGLKILQQYFLGLQLEGYLQMEQAELGLAALAQELPVKSALGRWWEAELYRLNGELLLMQNVASQAAETCFQQAIEIAQRQAAKSLELRATVNLSRLWQQQRKKEQAQQMLFEVYNWFTEGFDTIDLRVAQALLEELG